MRNLFLAILLLLFYSCGDILHPSKGGKDGPGSGKTSDQLAGEAPLEVTHNGSSWAYVSGKATKSVSHPNAVNLTLWDSFHADPCNFNGVTNNQLTVAALKNATTYLTATEFATVTDSIASVSTNIDTGKILIVKVSADAMELVFNFYENDDLKAIGKFIVPVCN